VYNVSFKWYCCCCLLDGVLTLNWLVRLYLVSTVLGVDAMLRYRTRKGRLDVGRYGLPPLERRIGWTTNLVHAFTFTITRMNSDSITFYIWFFSLDNSCCMASWQLCRVCLLMGTPYR
jgi:hypothetical protein